MQIITLQSSVVVLYLLPQMELGMKERMRHLVQLHILLLIQTDGLLAMWGYLLGATVLNTLALCLDSSLVLYTQRCSKQHASLLHL